MGAYVKFCSVGEQDCAPDLRTEFMTRYGPPLGLMWAPKNFFNIRQATSRFDEAYPAAVIPGLANFPYESLRIRTEVSSITVVNAFGTLLLSGGSFDVLREQTRTTVSLALNALVIPLGWLDATDQATTAIPDVRWGTGEQHTYRYFDASSKESLAIIYSPIARVGLADPSAIEQVQFKHLAAVPEPQTALLFLLGRACCG